MMVKKKDGILRMCIDYRRLNEVEACPMLPKIVVTRQHLLLWGYYSGLDS